MPSQVCALLPGTHPDGVLTYGRRRASKFQRRKLDCSGPSTRNRNFVRCVKLKAESCAVLLLILSAPCTESSLPYSAFVPWCFCYCKFTRDREEQSPQTMAEEIRFRPQICPWMYLLIFPARNSRMRACVVVVVADITIKLYNGTEIERERENSFLDLTIYSNGNMKYSFPECA